VRKISFSARSTPSRVLTCRRHRAARCSYQSPGPPPVARAAVSRMADIAPAKFEGTTGPTALGTAAYTNDNQIDSRKYIVGTSMTPAFVKSP
jgi:hypothetical protein